MVSSPRLRGLVVTALRVNGCACEFLRATDDGKGVIDGVHRIISGHFEQLKAKQG